MAMYWNAKLVDATKPLPYTMTKHFLRVGIPRSTEECAGALCVLAQGKYRVRFYRNTVHVQEKNGGVVERYMTNEGVRMIEAFNDTKAIPELGPDKWHLQLDPPRETQTLAYRAKWEKKRRAKRRNYEKEAANNKKRAVSGKGQVRIGPNPKDIFGIREHAPRHSEW